MASRRPPSSLAPLCSPAIASSVAEKYKIAFCEPESTEELRDKLAVFYAQRTLTRRADPAAGLRNAIVWLASDESAKTTGHVIPVDGGLQEAFLR